MVHDGWPTGGPAKDVAADRHTLLELLSTPRIADALTAASASSVSVRNASLMRAAAFEAAEALRDAMAWIAEGL
jgi:hypothetical protein